MRGLIINIYLLIGAYQDGKTTKIKNWYLWLGIFGAIICKIIDILTVKNSLNFWLINMIPGTIFLVIAKMGKESIGDGDGWLLLILGNCFWGMRIWEVFYLSVILLSLFSLWMIIRKQGNRKTQIPYIPFLWLADTMLWGLQYVL